MSMIRCSGCEKVFDSDDDPDCFVGYYDPKRYGLKPDSDKVLCEWCRDEYPDLETGDEDDAIRTN